MRRFLRHIQTFLAVAILLTSGVWLALPRDICLTKVLVAEGCGCAAAQAVESESCPCCSTSMASRILTCSDNHFSDASKETEHQAGCLLISSHMSKFNGAERVQPAAPIFNVVAVLPLSVQLPNQQVLHVWQEAADNQGLNQLYSYRENCVLLI